jgi:N-acetylmuramoyl-L-alanine amidase
MPGKIFRFALLAVSLLPVGAFGAGSVDVEGMRLSGDAANTRLVVELSSPVTHTLFALENPPRIVLDLHGARIDRGRLRMPAGQGPVTNLRSANRDNGDARIVMDLSASARARSFIVPADGSQGHRMVVELEGQGRTAPAVVTKSVAGQGRDLVIAIDAGHGGKDPGAIGRRGTREKDVVLQIARRLAQKIDSEPGMRAYLTRDGDYFLALRQRMSRARSQRADLFVSIHADAFKNRKARGSSVYVLSTKGATDEAARWLAEKENAADLVGGVSLDDKDHMLASVLLDLSQSAAIDASAQVAEQVISNLGGVGALHRKDVQRAGFLVLKSPDIPSILVETAFISNLSEEKLLTTRRHQDRLAAAIMRGIRSYLYDNPPPGSLIAMGGGEGTDGVQHVIVRGDTLSGIANRYRVSLNALRRHNGLKGDRIRIGQVLRIPGASGS